MTDQMDSIFTSWDRRFGQHLEAARTRALLSRAQLALRVGVTEESIRRWERGARPSTERLTRLIVVLALDGAQFASLPAAPEGLPPLARRLREERSRRGVTQAQAGQLLGVAQATYAGWELGRTTPGTQFLAGLADFLGMEPDELAPLTATPFTVDTANWPPLGKFIGARRECLRMTRDELGRLVGVAPGTVVAWELGYRTVRPHQVPQLAAAIKVSLEELEAALPRRDGQLSALGQLIRARQRRLGLRRRDIAERAGLDEATLSRWAHGRHEPEVTSLQRLASALEVPFELVCREAGLTPA